MPVSQPGSLLPRHLSRKARWLGRILNVHRYRQLVEQGLCHRGVVQLKDYGLGAITYLYLHLVCLFLFQFCIGLTHKETVSVV